MTVSEMRQWCRDTGISTKTLNKSRKDLEGMDAICPVVGWRDGRPVLAWEPVLPVTQSATIIFDMDTQEHVESYGFWELLDKRNPQPDMSQVRDLEEWALRDVEKISLSDLPGLSGEEKAALAQDEVARILRNVPLVLSYGFDYGTRKEGGLSYLNYAMGAIREELVRLVVIARADEDLRREMSQQLNPLQGDSP